MVLVLSLVGMPARAAEEQAIQIKGSDTMVNLVQAWTEHFMEKNPSTFIAVTGGGSGTGFASLISGSADIAMASREIKAQEKETAMAKGLTPKEFKTALDGLAVVVNPKNPVKQLTMNQLADIFTGKIKNWKEVGGSDTKIVLLSREVNSGTHVYFKEHVLRHGDSSAKDEFAPNALLMPSSQAIADEINHNPGAIGYYGMGYIGKDHKALSIAKNDKSEYVYPTIDNVLSGTYPISRPLYLYTPNEPKGHVKEFIDYTLSNEGQAVVTEIDFVPIKKI